MTILRYALEDIAKCMDYNTATYRLEVTRPSEGERLQCVNIPRDWESAVGIILNAPGRPQGTSSRRRALALKQLDHRRQRSISANQRVGRTKTRDAAGADERPTN
jgi:hypothetical protein